MTGFAQFSVTPNQQSIGELIVGSASNDSKKPSRQQNTNAAQQAVQADPNKRRVLGVRCRSQNDRLSYFAPLVRAA